MKGINNTSINELICEKIALLKSNAKFATVHNYRGLLRFVEKNFGVLKAKDCDSACVMKMKNIMKDLSTSTQASYFACLRSIWNYARYKGYTGKTDYPFQLHSYEIDKCRVPRIQKRTESYLTRSDMSKLYYHWLSLPDEGKFNMSRKKYLALFLFSYLGNGANINDLLRLTYNTDYFNSGGRVISFVRHKTADKSPIKVKICIGKWLKPVFEYLADKPERNKPVLGSFLKGVSLDDEEKLLKRIMYANTYCSKRVRHECKILGIREDTSVTFARHSFATVLNHLGCNFSLIEMCLGHVLPGVSSHYIGSVNEEKLFEMTDLLIEEVS